jgi:hypothetical protein
MPVISLTDFVDIVSKSGLPKSTKVREIKTRPDYSPAFDYYKKFREGLVELHQDGGVKGDLKNLLLQSDMKKQQNYADLVQGYGKWWGRKKLTWVSPPASQLWSGHAIDVRVNPELGLQIDGQPHLLKLYMKDEKLTAPRVALITHLMSLTHSALVAPNTALAVLDVRNARLFLPGKANPAMTPTLMAELAYVASLWPTI